jgi:alpha-tubulin suppressor-like RCC1 family protein
MPGGAVSCWGWNFAGQLGNGNADQAHPTAIPSLTGVSLLRSGSAHTCALKPDVSLLCWGWNANGQLGDGSTVDRHAPTAVPL